MMNQYIEIREDIKRALDFKQPIVALESTIISHGMPYPSNIEMAKKVESIIYDEGAIAATIAIIEGVIKIGLNDEELELLATSKDVLKISKRDIAYAIAKKKTGATTVSATMLIANMVNIKVFATGGIGGVHRGASETFDISRDLEELSEIDIAVVCAGAKSILDLGLTLEYLETKGVEVIGYQTKELPAFYTRQSGFILELQLDSPDDIARLMYHKWMLQIKGGIVIANPIPSEHQLDAHAINQTINESLEKANEKGIKGKDVTPYLLNHVKEATEGKSLKANLELVYNNAYLAAKIAKAYNEL
jgi:pseudouridylate synthase